MGLCGNFTQSSFIENEKPEYTQMCVELYLNLIFKLLLSIGHNTLVVKYQ